MSQQNIFDGKIPLPDARLAAREKTLLRYAVVKSAAIKPPAR